MKRIRPRTLLVGIVVLALVLFAALAGQLLVVDQPQRSDAAVVLFGDLSDTRNEQGLKMLRGGYARELVLDAPDWKIYGRTFTEMARDYVRALPPAEAAHVHVCSFHGDSTQLELREIEPCMREAVPNAGKVLLVTSDYHTRRAASVARRALPRYQWSASATPDSEHFGVLWWQHREWAKTMAYEWEKTIWWNAAERWMTH